MSNSASLVPQGHNRQVAALVSAFESETQGVILRTSPRHEHGTLYVLLVMLVISMTFISVESIDIVVSGNGRTVASAGALYVQPLDKGIVREIRVRTGDMVRKGQVLAKLDPTFAEADVAKLQQTMDSMRVEVSRLEAEQAGLPYKPAGSGPYDQLQLSIYQRRQAELKSSVGNLDAQIQSAEETLKQNQRDVATYNQRLRVSSDLEDIQVKLEKQGWGSRLKALTAHDARLEVERLLSASTNQIQDTQQKIVGLKAQRTAFTDHWQSDIAQWLSNDKNTLEKTQQDLEKAQRVNQLVEIVAPADAYVLKIGKAASVGAVIGSDSGDPLFTLARLDTPLEVEMMLSPKDIGFVRVGDPVDIKLDAYRYTYYGTAKGTVETVSDGSFTLDENNSPAPPYYKARIALTDVHLSNVPSDFHLIPGMTLTGDIVAGKRTIASYIIEGVKRTGSEAFREP
jgi:hemolysin D